MFKKVLLGIAALVVVLCAVIATRPSGFHVERSLAMQAPADVVFPHLNDMKKWAGWNPWDQLDPNMEKKFEGPEAGVGSAYSWKGNDDVGEGAMTITESVTNEKVVHRLEFIKPFASVATTGFQIKPEGEGVLVTWTMDGKNDFIGKAFSLVMNMDAMIGKDFEKGLTTLKGKVEAEAVAKKQAEEEARKAAEAAAQASAAGAIPGDAGAAPVDSAMQPAAPATATP